MAPSKYYTTSTYVVSASADLVAALTIVAAAAHISCVRRLNVDD